MLVLKALGKRVILKILIIAFFFVVARPIHATQDGTMAQLYKWVALENTDMGRWSDSGQCLARGFLSEIKDKKIYSQFGEDGIISFIFSCIKPTDKYYVEFVRANCWYL